MPGCQLGSLVACQWAACIYMQHAAVTPTDMGHGTHAISTVSSSSPKIQRWPNYWKSPSELLEAVKINIIFKKIMFELLERPNY